MKLTCVSSSHYNRQTENSGRYDVFPLCCFSKAGHGAISCEAQLFANAVNFIASPNVANPFKSDEGKNGNANDQSYNCEDCEDDP